MIALYLKETEAPQSAAAHALLEEVLLREYGISAPQLQLGPRGKPYLPGGPEFNLSHTHGAVAAAISDSPVGLDVERVRPFHQLVPQRIMSPGEYRWFLERGERKRDFFVLWTLKESYYKLLGDGLPGFPNGTDFYYDGKWHLRGERLFFSVLEKNNLLLTLCSEKEISVSFHIA